MLTDPLLLTILIECCALFLLGNREPIFYLYWTAVTALTNVPANVCMNLISFDAKAIQGLAALTVEIFVFGAELLLGFLYTRNLKMSAKYSAVCNLASFFIGSVILMLINQF